MIRILSIAALLAVASPAVPAAAAAQGGLRGQPAPKQEPESPSNDHGLQPGPGPQSNNGPEAQAPQSPDDEELQPVALTTQDVQRIVRVLPEIARLGAQYSKRLESSGGEPQAGTTPPEMQQMEQILSREGLTLKQFAMQMATLVSTYFALSPQALDEQLPSLDDPDIQRMLNDPKISDAQKQRIRDEVKEAQANKDVLRKQLTQLATEDNKRVVAPLLPQVKAAIEQAQSAARGAQQGPAPVQP